MRRTFASLLAIFAVASLWKAHKARSETTETSVAPMSGGTRRHTTFPNAVAALSVLAALSSAVFAHFQVRSAEEQTNAMRRDLKQSIVSNDLKFVGGISLRLKGETGTIEIVNNSDMPITDAALWTLGRTPAKDGMDYLDTVRAPLSGVPTCHTLKISRERFLSAARVQIRNPTAQEVYLTLRSPSGSWYTISSSHEYTVDPPSSESAVEAAATSYPDQILGDTVTEGRIEDSRYAILDLPIGEEMPVVDRISVPAELTNDNC